MPSEEAAPTEEAKKPIISPEAIIVPTIDIIKTSYFLNQLSDAMSNTILVGSTGTGKTIVLKKFLRLQLSKKNMNPLLIYFTANTDSKSLQKRIEAKYEKHRKGVLKPSLS